ncbi:hypothetical protein COO60DRAFT_1560199 [Scenedesmus sp. NREL 46B-D3]|nr:hypothetical protein COO60DRAFT_1560199 [Scenedesmus sp. NREL 46B-D3]
MPHWAGSSSLQRRCWLLQAAALLQPLLLHCLLRLGPTDHDLAPNHQQTRRYPRRRWLCCPHGDAAHPCHWSLEHLLLLLLPCHLQLQVVCLLKMADAAPHRCPGLAAACPALLGPAPPSALYLQLHHPRSGAHALKKHCQPAPACFQNRDQLLLWVGWLIWRAVPPVAASAMI